MGNLTPYVVLVVVITFPIILWCFVMAVAGRISGWIALAMKYRATKPFDGPCWHFQHAQLRWLTNYSGVLTVGANSTGIYLSPMLLFRFGHPRLFIPWTDMRIEMKRTFWSGKHMEIRFPEMPGMVIRLTEKLAQKIATAVGPELQTSSKVD
jgi:hypothetical protein